MDHYTFLGVSYDAPSPLISAAYRKLALTLHPDKCTPPNASDAEKQRNVDRFIQLQQAYHVLTNEETREQYDAALKAGGVLSSSSVGVPLSCSEVDLDDCSYDDDTRVYSHPCRCGALYEMDETYLIQTGMDLFPCKQCSLVLRVLFEWRPEEDEVQASIDETSSPTQTATTTSTNNLDEVE